MDAFLEGGSNVFDAEIESTPNIEFQLSKWEDKEVLINKQIPENALFTTSIFLNKLRNFYQANLDIPLLIYGFSGCGKLTTILGIILECPAYFPSIEEKMDSRRVNNIIYFKSLDNEFAKLLVYENLFFLDIEILTSTTEISNYLCHIYRLSKSKSIDKSRKIIIIKHIEKCNKDLQRYITFMLDKINSSTSYIFLTTKLNQLDKKITTFCSRLVFEYPNETEFCTIFKNNYYNIFDKRYLSIPYMKKYWEIYYNNKYNIGNTISQIKYLLSNPNISLDKLKQDINSKSLLDNIARNFISKKMKLTALCSVVEIRKFIYTLSSINIDLLDFTKYIIKNLLKSKINNKSKSAILEQAGILSKNLPLINKELIATETFIYNLIYIIYSGGENPSNL
jgi:hypothetical protein